MSPTQGSASSTGQYVHANGLDIYYEEHGNGMPLLLLHGGTVTSQMWQSRLQAFTPHFRVITPDSRAHGKTKNPAGELSYRTMADDVAALIDALQLDAPLVFGYSDGGVIALELAMYHPGVASALVIGAATFAMTEQVLNFNRACGLEGPGIVNVDHLASAAPDWLELLKAVHVRDDDPDYWQELLTQVSVMWYAPLKYGMEDFAHIADPILYVVGDRDDIVTVEETATMFRLTRGAELAVLPNATHFTTLNEIGIGMVVDFLLRHSNASVPA
jgi:pimeloyl-ACP methyl ester carboxylesterase